MMFFSDGSRHYNDPKLAATVGFWAACFTGSDWGAWKYADVTTEESKRSDWLLSGLRFVAENFNALREHLAETRDAKKLGKALARYPESLLTDIGFTRADVIGLLDGQLTVADVEQRRQERTAKRYGRTTLPPQEEIYEEVWRQAA